MTNFIFKSQKTSTYKQLVNKLEAIQSELRHQRIEHSKILLQLDKLMRDKNLQKQVDEFYEEDVPARAETDDLD